MGHKAPCKPLEIRIFLSQNLSGLVRNNSPKFHRDRMNSRGTRKEQIDTNLFILKKCIYIYRY